MARVLVIKSNGADVKEIEIDYRSLKEEIEIESPITCITRVIGGNAYDIWLDDEGLFKEQDDGTILSSAFCNNANEILAGNILIARESNGEVSSLTDEDIELIYQNLKRIKQDCVINYETSIGLKKMKFAKSSIILEYSV
jgi:hypothetical protein